MVAGGGVTGGVAAAPRCVSPVVVVVGAVGVTSLDEVEGAVSGVVDADGAAGVGSVATGLLAIVVVLVAVLDVSGGRAAFGVGGAVAAVPWAAPVVVSLGRSARTRTTQQRRRRRRTAATPMKSPRFLRGGGSTSTGSPSSTSTDALSPEVTVDRTTSGAGVSKIATGSIGG